MTIETITPPRRFYLQRIEDEPGVSGVGRVADGLEFTDGTCVVRWLTEYRSTTVYDDIKTVEAIHGHGGKTKIYWLDEKSPMVRACCRCGSDYDWDGVHCHECGASPNIIVPQWFAEARLSQDRAKHERADKWLKELKWLRSKLPVPESIQAEQSIVKMADMIKEMIAEGHENPYTDRDWSVSLGNTSTGVKADSYQEARRKGADRLSWLCLMKEE